MAGNPYNIGPLHKTINDTQRLIGDLSLTSQFKVSLLLGSGTGFIKTAKKQRTVENHLADCGLLSNSNEKYDFMCAEAVLPGSTFDMAEESGSRQGIIERFPTRRIYSDFNLTFYVDSNYDLIRLFEEWMNFIDPLHSQNEVYQGSTVGQNRGSYLDSQDFYRFKYPNTYKKLIAISKFERDFVYQNSSKQSKSLRDQTTLTYQFIDAFPTNLTALPLSYEGSTITKTTVNFSYSRYVVMKHKGKGILNKTGNITEQMNQAQSPTTDDMGANYSDDAAANYVQQYFPGYTQPPPPNVDQGSFLNLGKFGSEVSRQDI